MARDSYGEGNNAGPGNKGQSACKSSRAKAALQKQPCKSSPAKAAPPDQALAKEARLAQIGMITLTVRKVADG
jgi:hypothetical protein